jgi:TRAP-type C4-dicarboxylate transport system substrate-binding protein
MKTKRTFLISLMVFGLIVELLFILPLASVAVSETTWKMQHIYGPTSFQSVELKRFAKDVASSTM